MCLYVVTRFLICVYLDVFNKMFYFKLCKCWHRRANIIYKTGFKNFTLLHSTKIYNISLYKYLKNYNLQDASGGTLTHFVKDGLRFMFT